MPRSCHEKKARVSGAPRKHCKVIRKIGLYAWTRSIIHFARRTPRIHLSKIVLKFRHVSIEMMPCIRHERIGLAAWVPLLTRKIVIHSPSPIHITLSGCYYVWWCAREVLWCNSDIFVAFFSNMTERLRNEMNVRLRGVVCICFSKRDGWHLNFSLTMVRNIGIDLTSTDFSKPY